MLEVVRNILFLPIIVARDVLKSERSALAKIGYFLLVIFFLGLPWISGYRTAIRLTKFYSYELGLTDKLTEIQVSGESMLPTIEDGSKIQLHNPKKYKIKRGDIISFKNIETGGLHYLKRAIGLSEENVSLKNGYVVINGQILKEDYLLNNLPTYGNTFLVECNSYQVPKDRFLVLGDNRTVSVDSRVVGFVSQNDIDGVIKTNLQEQFLSESSQKKILKAKIDENRLLEKINQIRKESGIPPLTTNPLLQETAKNRVESIKTNFNDWKEKATPIDDLLKEKGYSYNLAHEFVTFGYLDEESIVKQILESATDEMLFLSIDFMEIGIATMEISNQECTFPIISVIISWPSIPTYSQEMIDSWTQELTSAKELLTLLQSFQGTPNIDQAELRELINNVAESVNIATQIVQKVNAKEWLDYQQVNRYYQIIDETTPKIENFFKKVQSSLPNLPLNRAAPAP